MVCIRFIIQVCSAYIIRYPLRLTQISTTLGSIAPTIVSRICTIEINEASVDERYLFSTKSGSGGNHMGFGKALSNFNVVTMPIRNAPVSYCG